MAKQGELGRVKKLDQLVLAKTKRRENMSSDKNTCFPILIFLLPPTSPCSNKRSPIILEFFSDMSSWVQLSDQKLDHYKGIERLLLALSTYSFTFRFNVKALISIYERHERREFGG